MHHGGQHARALPVTRSGLLASTSPSGLLAIDLAIAGRALAATCVPVPSAPRAYGLSYASNGLAKGTLRRTRPRSGPRARLGVRRREGRLRRPSPSEAEEAWPSMGEGQASTYCGVWLRFLTRPLFECSCADRVRMRCVGWVSSPSNITSQLTGWP